MRKSSKNLSKMGTTKEMKPVLAENSKQVERISEIHFFKLNESDKKLKEINEVASGFYQREFEIKALQEALEKDKVELDNKNRLMRNDRQALYQELQSTYGTVNIDPATGNIHREAAN